MNKWFNNFATKISAFAGRSYTFAGAVCLIILWLVSGPLMGFSDTWQLLINTLTTLITFLMVFVIQNSQNRADNSQQIKLDFILQVLGVEDKNVRKLETLDDESLDKLLEEVQEGQRKKTRKPKTRKANS